MSASSSSSIFDPPPSKSRKASASKSRKSSGRVFAQRSESDTSVDSDGLTERQKVLFRQQFDKLDVDRSGVLKPAEISAVAAALGSDDDLGSAASLISAHGDSSSDSDSDSSSGSGVDFEGFCKLLGRLQTLQYRTIYEAFRMLGPDDDGRVDDSSLKSLMKSLGRADYTASKGKSLGMIDVAQLSVQGVNPDFIDNAVLNKDKGAVAELLERLPTDQRGQLTLKQFARMLGHRGYVGELSDLSSVSDSSNDVDPGRPAGVKPKRGGERSVAGPAQVRALEFFVGDEYTFAYTAETTVSDAVAEIVRQSGVEAERIRLFFRGYEVGSSGGKKSKATTAKGAKKGAKSSDKATGSTKLSALGYKPEDSVDHPLFVLYHPMGTLATEQVFPKGKSSPPDSAYVFKSFKHEGRLLDKDAIRILKAAAKIAREQRTCVEVEQADGGAVTIIGDLHGQFFDLIEVFHTAGGAISPKSSQFVFLGDYVDRGYFSSETLLYLCAAMVQHPDKVTLLRGNHESESQNSKPSCATRTEFLGKYSEEVYDAALEFFHALPVCAIVVAGGKRFFCAHGGIHRDFPLLSALEDYDRFNSDDESLQGPLKNFMWNDPGVSTSYALASERQPPKPRYVLADVPDEVSSVGSDSDSSDWSNNSARGEGIKKYGLGALDRFQRRNQIAAVFRGHEQKPGYETHRGGAFEGMPSMFTVFSAPNYTDASMQPGALAVFDKKGVLSIKTYPWRLHPIYHTAQSATPYTKHYLFEELLIWLQEFNPELLRSVPVVKMRALVQARQFIAELRRRGRDVVLQDLQTSSTDWEFLQANLLEVLKESESASVRAYRKARLRDSMSVDWSRAFSFGADAILREAQNELQEITMDL
eukprot:c16821_g1_i1.p1 GENE.c16821_g1_i1~~c16821_g1_i1.p1  ORF type:complete len:881 (+),score=190.84 c16821_g1_i1:35-2644(+)